MHKDDIAEIETAVKALNKVLAEKWEKYGDAVSIYPRTQYSSEARIAAVSVDVTLGRFTIGGFQE